MKNVRKIFGLSGAQRREGLVPSAPPRSGTSHPKAGRVRVSPAGRVRRPPAWPAARAPHLARAVTRHFFQLGIEHGHPLCLL